MRQQLPVYSPISLSAFGPGFTAALGRNGHAREALAHALASRFGSHHVILTDSGTSALVLALRAMVGAGGTVALPGYGCVDLTAAALYAGVKVVLYDLDPATLSPDLDSVTRALTRGAAAVVVAHLYGFPADVDGVAERARAHGAAVIEDAAQAAGGTLHGAPLGSLGEVTVLSFGRGKGLTGGRGGALLAKTAAGAARLESVDLAPGLPAGWRDLTIAAAQFVFGRPRLYAIPAAIPWLRLGDMVFHPAHEPRALSAAAAAVVHAMWPAADRETEMRRRNAATLLTASGDAEGLCMIHPVGGGTAGYLRFPVRDSGQREEARHLGILRGYPRALIEQPELRPCLAPNEPTPPGAAELRRSLFTLPVHGKLTPGDLAQVMAWLTSAAARGPARPTPSA